MNSEHKAIAFLLLVTLIWGATFPLIRDAVVYMSAGNFVFCRFVLASIVMLPLVWKHLGATNKKLLFGGLALGALNSLTYTFQSIGLETISSARAAFITGSSVILVPFISALFGLGRIKTIDMVSVFICMLGLYLLTGANLSGLTVGDLWVAGCALFFALTVVFVKWFTKHAQDTMALTFYQILFAVPVIGVGARGIQVSAFSHHEVVYALLFCGVFSTAFTLFLQMKYQHFTTPTKAALIYTLEPVFASFFAWEFNNEVVTAKLIFGGGLIILSVVLNDLWQVVCVRLRLSQKLV